MLLLAAALYMPLYPLPFQMQQVSLPPETG
jgi:hypothetical protein